MRRTRGALFIFLAVLLWLALGLLVVRTVGRRPAVPPPAHHWKGKTKREVRAALGPPDTVRDGAWRYGPQRRAAADIDAGVYTGVTLRFEGDVCVTAEE